MPFTFATPFICLGIGAMFAVPYLLDRAIGERLSGLARTMLLPAATVLTEYVAEGGFGEVGGRMSASRLGSDVS